MRTLFLLLFTSLSLVVNAQSAGSVLGRWNSIDDRTGKPRSVVEITAHKGMLSGRVVDLHDKAKLEKLCTKCEDDRKDKRIVGLEIIRNMKAEGSEWEGGTILDPESGRVYDCKMWLEDGRLKVRGYIMFFYRTQTWVR